ncbi:hypothetical protein AC249_AIPGENE15936 [Exaiptasia diaphana]|nr:hypothetical protein AC249_AIPGENE15936 [Exaiptasia diaphana]
MKLKSTILAIFVFAFLMESNYDVQREKALQGPIYMKTTNTNKTLNEAQSKLWLSPGALVFTGLMESWEAVSRVATQTVITVYNDSIYSDLPGKAFLDFLDNHVMYYPKTLVRVVSALTQVSHGQIICLSIVTVHHVIVPASLRDYVMLPSLVMFADYIADEPTVTTADYIGHFNLWNKTVESMQCFSHNLMELFVDVETVKHGGLCTDCVLDVLYSLVSAPYALFFNH